MRIFSFGGGVQSTAALVLAAREDLVVDALIFANVGDDSENPATLAYVRDVAMPYARRRGVPLIEVRRTRRDGSRETLYERLTCPSSRGVPIPVRMSNGAPGTRACTADWKIRVVARWAWAHGARAQRPAEVQLGISVDEWRRMRTESGISYIRHGYPLIERRMSRADCVALIRAEGLPTPPKSSCWFCPFHRLSAWREMRRREPELFARAVALERLLNDRRAALGRDPAWLSRALKPLDKAVGESIQGPLFEDDLEDDLCESGFRMV